MAFLGKMFGGSQQSAIDPAQQAKIQHQKNAFEMEKAKEIIGEKMKKMEVFSLTLTKKTNRLR